MASAVASEHERIEELRRIFAPEASHDVWLGIGDDAAVLAPSVGATVLSVDAQVEGVHFRRDLLAPEDIGYRALVAAVSDLAAMGATPRAALMAMVMPSELPEAMLYAIARGAAEAARRYGCPIVGGNLARGSEVSLTTTVVGTPVAKALSRGGARVGDALFVVGMLGDAALGLHALVAGRAAVAPGSVQRWRRPEAQVAAGCSVAHVATAAVDVSDGLLQDLGHVARASGVGFELMVDELPHGPELRTASEALGVDGEALMLTGGEDYALLFTARPEATPPAGVRIGRAVSEPGIRLRRRDGSAVSAPTALGFDHFRG